jgi:hypothetical protein
MISSSFAIFLIVMLFAGIAFLGIGVVNEIDGVAFVGTLFLAIEAAGIIAVSMLIISGDMQLWKTDKLAVHIAEMSQTKEKTPNCYTINNNKLCGEFIYEDATHHYEYKNNTLFIDLKK